VTDITNISATMVDIKVLGTIDYKKSLLGFVDIDITTTLIIDSNNISEQPTLFNKVQTFYHPHLYSW